MLYNRRTSLKKLCVPSQQRGTRPVETTFAGRDPQGRTTFGQLVQFPPVVKNHKAVGHLSSELQICLGAGGGTGTGENGMAEVGGRKENVKILLTPISLLFPQAACPLQQAPVPSALATVRVLHLFSTNPLLSDKAQDLGH